MTKSAFFAFLSALSIGLAGGYWLAKQQTSSHELAEPAKPLYFRHPMNPQVTSPTPAKDEMGMDYQAVYAETADTPASGQNKPVSKGRILYYRHPMGAADTSSEPKKDEMGMDYLPVYEGEVLNAKLISISPEKIQKLGVKFASAEQRSLSHNLRALGSIQVDERRVQVVNAKFEGWIDKLYVNASGQSVQRGQALMSVYSPDLISAQQEYLIAKQGEQLLQQASPQAQASARQLSENALQRLRYWDIAPAQLSQLEQRGTALASLPLLSPLTGVLLEKPALAGMRFMPGEKLFQIADLSQVWLLVDVFEQDLAWVKSGQSVTVHINAYPDRHFSGAISFIAPTLDTDTRSVKVRVELANPQGLLKPGLYGSVVLQTGPAVPVLCIPDAALLDSGNRQQVLVALGEGSFEPRQVTVGRRLDGYAEILSGLRAGEKVVTSANFLIDAESNLKAALNAMSPGEAAPMSETDSPNQTHAAHSGGH